MCVCVCVCVLVRCRQAGLFVYAAGALAAAGVCRQRAKAREEEAVRGDHSNHSIQIQDAQQCTLVILENLILIYTCIHTHTWIDRITQFD